MKLYNPCSIVWLLNVKQDVLAAFFSYVCNCRTNAFQFQVDFVSAVFALAYRNDLDLIRDAVAELKTTKR